MKIIRWWGVVTFFVIAIILILAWYFIAPMIIKSSIETAGSKMTGAKFDVNQVDLHLFPLGVTVNQIEIADKDQPMINLVEIETLKFALDTSKLLWKKISIDELKINGIQLNTKRTFSGAIEANQTPDKRNSGNDQLVSGTSELTKDEIKKMVANADLVTLKNLEKLETKQESIKVFWQNEIESTKHEKNLKTIELEFNRLSKRAKKSSLNLIKDRKAWKILEKKISKERKKISDLNKKLKNDSKNLIQQVKKVKNSPQVDLDNIMSKTGLSGGLTGMTRKLSDQFIGPQFTPWLEKIITFVKQNKMASQEKSDTNSAVYDTDKGTMVQFKDENVFPKLLIKKVSLSGKDDQWLSTGTGNNLGYYPWTINAPADLTINIKNLKGKSNANATITSEWKNSREMNTQIQSKINNWNINNVKLLQSEQGSWMINSGILDASITGNVTLDKVNLKLKLSIFNPNIQPPKGLSGWQKSLTTGLSKTNLIKVTILANGDLSNPRFSLSSNLEKIFSSALGDNLKQKTSKYKKEVSQQISERVGDLSSLNDLSDNFDEWSKKLQINDSLLKNIKVNL